MPDTTRPPKELVREYFERRTHAPLDPPPSVERSGASWAGICCRPRASRTATNEIERAGHDTLAAQEVHHEVA